jgi:hypothetical protein
MDPMKPKPVDEAAESGMWNAYGHALGAAAGLEFSMRFALWEAINTKYTNDPDTAGKVRARVNRMTLGPMSILFQGVFTGFGADAKFVKAMEVAVATRNRLAHHFLDGRVEALKSSEAIDLITVECGLASAHFADVEYFVRSLCPIDFEKLFKKEQSANEDYVLNHPLRDHFLAFRAGEIETGDLLRQWQRMEMGDIVDEPAHHAATAK